MRGWRICMLLALLVVSLTSQVRGGEEYYLLMFSAQRVPNQPNYSHSFATFVKASWEGSGPCPTDAALEAHTISWLPANLHVRTLAPRAECGHNFDVHTTLDFCLHG